MKIVLSGVETNNKGAELMLYAILQELERKHPESEVFIDKIMMKQGISYVNTSIKINLIEPSALQKLFLNTKITGILNRLGLFSRYLNNSCPVRDADYFIDGSGLLFTDKRMDTKGVAKSWQKKLSGYKKHGTKIVFLPQGFGPFAKSESKATIKVLDDYADLILAREQVSYDYLQPVIKHKEKVKKFTDFSSLVEGKLPEQYAHLAGKVCLIPNFQMMRMISKEGYFAILTEIINTCKESGHDVYLLNHEGIRDEVLIKDYLSTNNADVEFVNGLNGLEVKGLISTAYLVVSSRFHGVASSLNGAVPCLATSWHHKYAELFKDFGLDDCVLPLDDELQRIAKLQAFLNPRKNNEIRQLLASKKPAIQEQNRQMWQLIWSI